MLLPFAYSEQSKLEMEKFLMELATRIIREGYFEQTEDGCTRRVDFTIANVDELYKHLRVTLGTEILCY